MKVLQDKRLTPLDYWDRAKEVVLGDQKTGLTDGLFSMPEGVWHSVRWRSDVDVKRANSSEFNVVSMLFLDISDPLDLENILQEKLNKSLYRLSAVEALCCDMYRALDKVAANLETLVGQPMRTLTDESAAEIRRDLDCCKERMDELGLLEVER